MTGWIFDRLIAPVLYGPACGAPPNLELRGLDAGKCVIRSSRGRAHRWEWHADGAGWIWTDDGRAHWMGTDDDSLVQWTKATE